MNTRSFEKEANRLHLLSLSVAESPHELLEPGVPLYLEKDLVVVVCNLDVEVLRRGSGVSVAMVRHIGPDDGSSSLLRDWELH